MWKETFVLGAIAALATTAHATLFSTVSGVASADITAVPSGPNTLVTVVLNNLTPAVSTTSAGNLLTGIDFTSVGGMALNAQTAAKEFNFATQTTGSVNSGGPFDPSWAIVAGKGLYFDGFGSGGKPVIGPATGDTTYAGANPSLTSGPHGPYEYKTATFTLLAPGAFDPDALTDVTFRFNTDGNITVPGTPDSGGGVPEPASLAILGLGGIGLLRRRRAA